MLIYPPSHPINAITGVAMISIVQIRLYTLIALMFITAYPVQADIGEKSYQLSDELAEERAYTLGVQAYVYAYPLVHMNRYRQVIKLANGKPYGAENGMEHRRELTEPRDSVGDTTNNDTLYTPSFMDLRPGPIVVTIPEIRDRYYSIQFTDFYSANYAILGARKLGQHGAKVLIAGPNWKGDKPTDVDHVVISPTPWSYTVLRVAVYSSDDLNAVHAVQDGFVVKRLDAQGREVDAGERAADLPRPAKLDEPMDIWRVINEELTANPPPAKHGALTDAFVEIGVGPGLPSDFSDVSEAVRRGLVRAVNTGKTLIQAQADQIGGQMVSGWAFLPRHVGRYDNDFLLRAGVNLMGFVALQPEEATYIGGYFDSTGELLNGKNRYRIHFEKEELPPVDGFWSITMYDSKTYGMTPNELKRYSIGDRTPGIVYGEDGSLDITIQHEQPEDKDSAANWLPSPAGEFYIFMRAYEPQPAIVQRSWLPQPLERL
jgi:hypothetical protein